MANGAFNVGFAVARHSGGGVGTAFVVGFIRIGTEFDAEDGFDAGLFGGEDELDDAVEVAGIGEGDGWAMVLGGQVDDVLRREGRVEKRVVAVNAKGGGGGGCGWGWAFRPGRLRPGAGAPMMVCEWVLE